MLYINMSSTRFNIIVAYDSCRGISKNGGIPWDIKDDMAWFRNVTLHTSLPKQQNAVIMGRKTWESLKGPLPGRINIVVTQKKKIDDAAVAESLSAALYVATANAAERIFVIGGAQLYAEALRHPGLHNIYATAINYDYGCDLFFPQICKYVRIKHAQIYRSFDGNNMVDVKITQQAVPKWTPHLLATQGEHQYLEALEHLLTHGEHRATRNSDTYSTFGCMMVFDLEHFPVITTKRVYLRGVFEELKFFLLGKTNTRELSEKGVRIWEPNTSREFLESCGLPYEEGDMGNMYGLQLRAFGCDYTGCDRNYIGTGTDQIQNSLDLLRRDPASRRNILTTYDPSHVHQGVLYPCHGIAIQFYVTEDGGLCCHMTQRSADIICGVPFNISSYALWVYIYCAILNGSGTRQYHPKRLTISFGDLHLYDQPDHIACAREQLQRTPYGFPDLRIDRELHSIDDVANLEFSDLVFTNYQTHPAISVKMVA